jgi:cytoskeletal protein CcmA (bactofilin family)
VIGEDAVVTAKIMAGVVICRGKVTGDIVATEKVKLLAPAMVTASVKAPVISIEEGVMLNGSLEMEQAGGKSQRDSHVHALPNATASVKRVS